MSRSPNLVLLNLDTFRTNGGIQQVCRTLAYTLKSLSTNASFNFHLLSLNDQYPDARYLDHPDFRGFKRNKIRFLINAIMKGLRCKTIIISHIHLLPIAFCIKILNKNIQIIMLAHGKESWNKFHPLKTNFIRKHVNIWAVSNFTKQMLLKHNLLQSSAITILNNCLDPFFKTPDNFEKPFWLLKKYGLSKDHQILLSICRITEHEHHKGYDLIIKLIPQLLNEFPNLHYLLCGSSEPNEKIRLQKLILRLNLQDHITLVDYIAEDELSKYYLLADLFILPSKKEGFGLVFIEAAACGCKVISGNIDGSTDAMLNGKLGKMVNPEKPAMIYKEILETLKDGSNHHSALNTQQLCLANFNHLKYQQQVKCLLKL